MNNHDSSPENAPLDAQALGKLKWRCKRGLLENDLFIARFFERHGENLTGRQARAMQILMDLSDYDLLDLLLQRKEPEPDWAGPDVVAVLQLMRTEGFQPPPAVTDRPPTSFH